MLFVCLFWGLDFVCLEETMEEWDQETLEKVVAQKNAEYKQNKPTEIVCYSLSFITFAYFC